jgi:hypothetical protein
MENQPYYKIISKNKGFTLILIAIAMLGIIGMVALAIDLGNAYMVKGQLQKAADAGALAGAGTIYPPNTTPPPLIFPNPDFVTPLTTANTFSKLNKADGDNLTDSDIANIVAGYWRLGQTTTSDIQPQSTIPTGKCSISGNSCDPRLNNCGTAGDECLFQDVPGVKVTVQKSVPTYFAKVFGFNEFTLQASAVSVVGPAKSAQGVIPVALSKCMIDNYFGPSHPVPLPTSLTIESPYAPGGAGCNVGQWTSLTYCSNNSENTIRDLISGAKTTPPLSIGETICMTPGVRTPGYRDIQDKYTGSVVEMPVVLDVSADPAMITGFATFQIDTVNVNGSHSTITGHLLAYYTFAGASSPGGSLGNTITPPILVK